MTQEDDLLKNMYEKEKTKRQYVKFNQQQILNNMEDFCAHEHIFFSEKDRIAYQLKKSKALYGKFKDSLNKGFRNFKEFKDNAKFDFLVNQEVNIDKILNKKNPFDALS